MLCSTCASGKIPGEPLRGVLEVRLRGSLEGPLTAHALLPVEERFIPDIPVGNTPLWKSENLNARHGFPALYLKDDGLNPTGSLKDRASLLVAAFARMHGLKEVIVASTGNAGSSMAGVGASAGLRVKLFLPKTAPRAKMIQALQYGADVIMAEKNYDQAFELSLQYSRERGGLNRNTAYNPLTIEGKKTVSLEVYRQLEIVPDYLFVSVGDGVILSGVYKGFRDLKQLGLIKKIPVIYAVQASGSSAINRALEKGVFEPTPSKTVADSISVDVPSNGYLALKNLRQHHGRCILVDDDEILRAQKELSATCGLFCEPAAAAAFAGFLKEKGALQQNAVCVVLLTGNGLKDIQAASLQVNMPEKAVNSLTEIP